MFLKTYQYSQENTSFVVSFPWRPAVLSTSDSKPGVFLCEMCKNTYLLTHFTQENGCSWKLSKAFRNTFYKGVLFFTWKTCSHLFSRVSFGDKFGEIMSIWKGVIGLHDKTLKTSHKKLKMGKNIRH